MLLSCALSLKSPSVGVLVGTMTADVFLACATESSTTQILSLILNHLSRLLALSHKLM